MQVQGLQTSGLHTPLNRNASGKGRTKRTVLKDVFPILEWLPSYNWKENLTVDIAGGVTLGCILMGQSLAHAALCQVSLINGPYSCILPPIVYAVFGTCIHASVGTGGLISLLTGQALLQYGDLEQRTQINGLLTMLVGIILALMGICQLAFLVRFLSKPALSGFITASAVLIMTSQITPMLGLPKWAAKGGIVNVTLHHPGNFEYSNRYTCIVSVVALAFLMNVKSLKAVKIGGKKLLKPISDFKELILLAVSAVFAAGFNAVASEQDKIEVVGGMPSGLPSFSMPHGWNDWELIKELLPSAALIAIVTFVSSFAGAKKFALMDGYQVKAFNELLALGMANVVGALNGAVPTQVGLSRMGIAHQAGIQTQLGANVFVGVVVGLITQLFSSYLYNVPKCVLNCIIINGAMHLTEFSKFHELYKLALNKKYHWKMKMEVWVWTTGFVSTLYTGAFAGMLIAMGVSMFLIIYQVVNPALTPLGYKPNDPTDQSGRARAWVGKQREGVEFEEGVLVYRIEGPIFYANVEVMQEWLEEQEVLAQQEGDPIKGIILSAAAVPFVDATAIDVLETLVKSYLDRHIYFFIANTFGQPGRLISDRLEKWFEKEVRAGLKEKVAKCSSIDDFVDLIHESSEAVSPTERRMMSLRIYAKPSQRPTH